MGLGTAQSGATLVSRPYLRRICSSGRHHRDRYSGVLRL